MNPFQFMNTKVLSILLLTISYVLLLTTRFILPSSNSKLMFNFSLAIQFIVIAFVLILYFVPLSIPFSFIINLSLHIITLILLITTFILYRSSFSTVPLLMFSFCIVFFISSIPFTLIALKKRPEDIDQEVKRQVDQSPSPSIDDEDEYIVKQVQQETKQKKKKTSSNQKQKEMKNYSEMNIQKETNQNPVQQVPPCNYDVNTILKNLRTNSSSVNQSIPSKPNKYLEKPISVELNQDQDTDENEIDDILMSPSKSYQGPISRPTISMNNELVDVQPFSELYEIDMDMNSYDI